MSRRQKASPYKCGAHNRTTDRDALVAVGRRSNALWYGTAVICTCEGGWDTTADLWETLWLLNTCPHKYLRWCATSSLCWQLLEVILCCSVVMQHPGGHSSPYLWPFYCCGLRPQRTIAAEGREESLCDLSNVTESLRACCLPARLMFQYGQCSGMVDIEVPQSMLFAGTLDVSVWSMFWYGWYWGPSEHVVCRHAWCFTPQK